MINIFSYGNVTDFPCASDRIYFVCCIQDRG